MKNKLLVIIFTIYTMLNSIQANDKKIVSFWYHFDNADNPMATLVKKFETENPNIKIKAENIPWGSYYDRLYTSIVADSGPDTAMVKMFAQPRLIEMEALEPIGDRLANWKGKNDIQPNLFDLTKGKDGKFYYMPVQYVVLYLYYRVDMFKKAGLTPPKTCSALRSAAKILTNGEVYGFGFRGGKGGHDHWASFVLSTGANFKLGGLTSSRAIKATQFVIDLFKKDKVFPPSAPNDGFKEIISAFKAGKTAMTIHHIGSANSIVKVLGDKVSATVVPKCGGGRWTTFGDESTAIFSAAKNKNAAWKWITFLSSKKNNANFNKATGQLPVTKSDSLNWSLHKKRFVTATINSLPFANLLPNVPHTSDFVNTVWPINMQRALIGEIKAVEMNKIIEKLYNK